MKMKIYDGIKWGAKWKKLLIASPNEIKYIFSGAVSFLSGGDTQQQQQQNNSWRTWNAISISLHMYERGIQEDICNFFAIQAEVTEKKANGPHEL